MSKPLIVNTGPLVAALDRRDAHHEWARAQLANTSPPMLTCEPVLTEACFLLRHFPPAASNLLRMLPRGMLEVRFVLNDHAESVAELIERYANVPMSLADACLVRMAELHQKSTVLTLDSDFQRYRKHRRQPIPLRIPARL